jgi:TPR repeat protein
MQFVAMSRALSHHRQRSLENLQQLLTWYKIRDTLLGHNHVKQDVKKALASAAVCEHLDAIWLTNLFTGRDVSTVEEARQVFLGCENDPRALCLAAILDDSDHEICRAAVLGGALSQASMAFKTYGDECFRWAGKAAVQGERDGFFWLGCCNRNGQGCVKDVEKAKECFLIAAELGCVNSMIELGLLLEESCPQRFLWLGKAAVNGHYGRFLSKMEEQICNFRFGIGHANVVFEIGRALKGHIDNEKREIFRSANKFDSRIVPATDALQFYNFQLESYRKAVDTWTFVAIRCKVVKDIRKMIGKIIWDARDEAKYVKEK